MGAVEDLKYYRDKGGMGLSALSIEQRGVIELDERLEILWASLEELEEKIDDMAQSINTLFEVTKVIKNDLHPEASPNQAVHRSEFDDHPSGHPVDND